MPLNDTWLSGRTNQTGVGDDYLALLRQRRLWPAQAFNAWVNTPPKPVALPKPVKPPRPVKPPKPLPVEWPHEVECLVCQKPFPARNSQQIRCAPCQAERRSGRAGKNAQREARKGAPIAYACEVCGKVIMGWAKLVRVACSPECRQARWNRIRQVRWKEKHG